MQDKIKVLHVVPGMGSGGVAKMIQEWYMNIDNNEFIFDVATLDTFGLFSQQLTEAGGNIITFKPLREVGIIKYLRNLDDIISKGNYDIVHSHMGLLSFLVFIIAKKYKIKSRFLHAHTNLFYNDDKKGVKRGFINCIKKLCVILSTDYCACTNEAGEYFFGKKIIRKDKYNLLLNAIDVERFKYDPDKRKELRQIYVENNQFIIGNIGRFSKQKNHELILNVFNEVLTLKPNSELWLIGEGEDEENIIKHATNLGIISKIKFWGVRENVEDFLQCMDVFFMPSLFEGLGIVAIEAQACGLSCVVSSKVPKEVKITDEVHFLDLKEDNRKWAELLIKCGEHTRKDTKMEVIESGYDIKENTKTLLELYKRSLAKINDRDLIKEWN